MAFPQFGTRTKPRDAEEIAAKFASMYTGRFLKLDASNDPVTGDLLLHPAAAHALTRYQRLTIGETTDPAGVHYMIGNTLPVSYVTITGAELAFTSEDGFYGGGVAWTDPSKAAALDDDPTTCAITVAGGHQSACLKVNLPAGSWIPANAIPVGFVLTIHEKAADASAAYERYVGAITGTSTAFADNIANLPALDTDYQISDHGDATNGWNIDGRIDAAMVNGGDLSFGVICGIDTITPVETTVSIDYIELEIDYVVNSWVAGIDDQNADFVIKAGVGFHAYATRFTRNGQLYSGVYPGVAPFQTASTTLNTNLNADLLDGNHAAAFAPASHDILSASHGDTTAAAVVRGDLVVGIGATPKWERLGVGAQYSFLHTADGIDTAWSTGGIYFEGATSLLTLVSSIRLHGDGYTLALGMDSGLTGTLSGGGEVDTGSAYTLTVPASGTAALGTGTAGYATFWTDANTLSADANFRWDNTNKRLGVGNIAPAYPFEVYNVANFAAAEIHNIHSELQNIGTGVTYGHYVFCVSRNTGGTVTRTSGLRFDAGAYGSNATSQTIQNAEGVIGVNYYTLTGTGNITITASRAFYAAAPNITKSGAGTLAIAAAYGMQIGNIGNAYTTNGYGLYLDAQSGSGTGNFSIYGNAGLYRFGDQLAIDGSADRQQLVVTGFTTQAVAVTVAQITRNDTAAGISAILGLTALGSGANGDGGSVLYKGKTSTTAATEMALDQWLWVDATHASRKAKRVFSVYDTAVRSGLTIEADGAAADVYFEGGDGSGLPYGSCWGNEIGWSQASAAQNTWYQISDTDMTDGQLNLVTHDGSGKLTVTKAGRYLVNYAWSGDCSGVAKHVQLGISVSGTVGNDGVNHFYTTTASEQYSVSGTAILDLAANAYVEIAMRTTDTGDPTLTTDHLNFTMVQVGGT